MGTGPLNSKVLSPFLGPLRIRIMGPLIILSGPAGSGKSTIIRRLVEDKTWPLRLSVSVTTRAPRPGEVEGVHYYFRTKEVFRAEVAAGAFLEWAEVFGNYYGTLQAEVQPHRLRGIGVLLDIDVKGWEQVRRHCPDAVSIFVRASSMETYEKRLRERKTETEAAMQRRLAGAKLELARAPEYDYQVINEDLDTALASIRAILDPLFERNNDAG
jgi:guanylate kinase